MGLFATVPGERAGLLENLLKGFNQIIGNNLWLVLRLRFGFEDMRFVVWQPSLLTQGAQPAAAIPSVGLFDKGLRVFPSKFRTLEGELAVPTDEQRG